MLLACYALRDVLFRLCIWFLTGKGKFSCLNYAAGPFVILLVLNLGFNLATNENVVEG